MVGCLVVDNGSPAIDLADGIYLLHLPALSSRFHVDFSNSINPPGLAFRATLRVFGLFFGPELQLFASV